MVWIIPDVGRSKGVDCLQGQTGGYLVLPFSLWKDNAEMWKLAVVQGPNVQYFDATGGTRKSFSDFATAVAAMLKEGWEPFSADSGNAVMVWFRIRVS